MLDYLTDNAETFRSMHDAPRNTPVLVKTRYGAWHVATFSNVDFGDKGRHDAWTFAECSIPNLNEEFEIIAPVGWMPLPKM